MSDRKDAVYDIPLFVLYDNIQRKVTADVPHIGDPDPDYSIEYKPEDCVERKNVTRNLFELFGLTSIAANYKEYINEKHDFEVITRIGCFRVKREGKFKINIKLIIKNISKDIIAFHLRCGL